MMQIVQNVMRNIVRDQRNVCRKAYIVPNKTLLGLNGSLKSWIITSVPNEPKISFFRSHAALFQPSRNKSDLS